jgi:hypothetical protein
MSYGSASAALLTDSENQHGAARNDCIARTKKLGFHKIAGWPRLFHGFDTLVSRFVGFSLLAPTGLALFGAKKPAKYRVSTPFGATRRDSVDTRTTADAPFHICGRLILSHCYGLINLI